MTHARLKQLLSEAATELIAEAECLRECHTRGDGDWTGEEDAKADYDRLMALATSLRHEADTALPELLAENERLRAALTVCAGISLPPNRNLTIQIMRETARAALAIKEAK